MSGGILHEGIVCPEPDSAITIPLNRDKCMDQLKQAEDVNASLPACVLVRRGIQTLRKEARAAVRPTRS
jgi:hypothetical protein